MTIATKVKNQLLPFIPCFIVRNFDAHTFASEAAVSTLQFVHQHVIFSASTANLYNHNHFVYSL